MTFFQDETGTYLSMENYIEAMIVRLGIDADKGRRVSTPMSGPRRGQGATSNYDGWSGFNKYLKNSAPGHVGAWTKTTGRAPMSVSLTPSGRCVFLPCG